MHTLLLVVLLLFFPALFLNVGSIFEAIIAFCIHMASSSAMGKPSHNEGSQTHSTGFWLIEKYIGKEKVLIFITQNKFLVNPGQLFSTKIV